MLKYTICFVGACFFGYKFIDIFPKVDSFSELLSIFVFSPFTFFSSITCFFLSFFLYGELYQWLKKNSKQTSHHVILMIGIMASFILFIFIGGWKGVILLIFSIIYGMISAVNMNQTNVKGVK